jgi:hypothetical protein
VEKQFNLWMNNVAGLFLLKLTLVPSTRLLVFAVAHELHTTTPKLKLNVTSVRPPPPSKRKRGRPPKNAAAKSTTNSLYKKGSTTKTRAATGSGKKKPKAAGAVSDAATPTAAAPNDTAGDHTEI